MRKITKEKAMRFNTKIKKLLYDKKITQSERKTIGWRKSML